MIMLRSFEGEVVLVHRVLGYCSLNRSLKLVLRPLRLVLNS